MIVNGSSIVQNVIQIKIRITKHGNVNVKIAISKKGYSLNSTRIHVFVRLGNI